jgi:hypothetical protein
MNGYISILADIAFDFALASIYIATSLFVTMLMVA